MKKIIFTFAASFAIATVSAQSYPKQPDPSIVEVVRYQKPVTEVKEQPADAKNESLQTEPNQDRKEETSKEVKTTTSAVAVNEEKAATGKKNQK